MFLCIFVVVIAFFVMSRLISPPKCPSHHHPRNNFQPISFFFANTTIIYTLAFTFLSSCFAPQTHPPAPPQGCRFPHPPPPQRLSTTPLHYNLQHCRPNAQRSSALCNDSSSPQLCCYAPTPPAFTSAFSSSASFPSSSNHLPLGGRLDDASDQRGGAGDGTGQRGTTVLKQRGTSHAFPLLPADYFFFQAKNFDFFLLPTTTTTATK